MNTTSSYFRSGVCIEMESKVRVEESNISADFGLSNATFETAAYQKTVAGVSNKKICLVPHPKMGKESFSKVIDTKGFDILITDWEATLDEIKKIKELGVEVIVEGKGE